MLRNIKLNPILRSILSAKFMFKLPLNDLLYHKQKEMLVRKGLDKVLTYVNDMVVKTKATIAEFVHFILNTTFYLYLI